MEEQNQRLIRGFLRKRLSKSEKKEFLEQASSDKEFIKDFVSELKAEVEADEQSSREKGKDTPRTYLNRKRSRVGLYFSIAAATIIGAYFIFRAFIPGSDFLYEKYYDPLNVENLSTRAADDREDSRTIQMALQQYSKGSYEKASDLLSPLVEKENPDQLGILVYGLSLMEMEDFNGAVQVFNKLSGEQNILPEIIWYQGLCYLKSGDYQSTMQSLQRLESMALPIHKKEIHSLRKTINEKMN